MNLGEGGGYVQRKGSPGRRARRLKEGDMVRRGIILALMVGLVATACGGGGGEKKTTTTSKKVEVFSWWTAGGEAQALDALVKVFNQKYPNFSFDNAAVAGGGGSAARAVLATRLSANKPPASWQSHAGQEVLSNYADAGELQSLNSLFDQQGWTSVMPNGLLALLTARWTIYAVTVYILRANVIWYNAAVLKDNGVGVPTSRDA